MKDFTTDYEKGMIHYQTGGTIDRQQTFTPAFINGFHDEERNSRCGFTYTTWHKTKNYKTI